MNKIEFNTQICTTKEQSNRLLELGLKPETSDMLILPLPNSKELIVQKYEDESENLYYTIKGEEWESSPAWSLHRLIEMLSYKVNKSSNDASLLQITRIKDNCYIVGYYGYKVVEMPLFDAVIRLIEELIKDNLFNKEYLNETNK